MEELHFLKDLVIVYGVGSLVVYFLQRIGQSPILGFLLTGILIGPFGLGFISDTESVQILAEIGVMILLFTLGLEFSLGKLMQMRRVVLATGPLQVGLSILLVVLSTRAAGIEFNLGLLFGFVFALSSTAVVLRMLSDGAEIDSIHGRVSLGVLIFQDLCLVPMIVVIPLLATSGDLWMPIAAALGKAFLVVAVVVVGARYLFPFLLHQVVRTRSQELFMITSIFLLLGTAWVTAEAGFSLVLGAFLAGLALSESEYSHQIFSRIRPLQDSLNSLFFISIGMLVDPKSLISHLPLIALLILVVILGKSLITGAAVLATGFPMQVALLSALPMAQIGEFSFVLLQQGSSWGVLPSDWYQILITVIVSTMILTPALRWLARLLISSTALGKWGVAWGRSASHERLDKAIEKLSDHVIICGFGVSGENVSSVLAGNSIPHLILELNPQTVSDGRNRGLPIFFGDCTDPEILIHAGIKQARVLLLVISDPFSTRRAVQVAQGLNPDLCILTRTKYVAEIDELHDLGSAEVVSEEFEASFELIWRILRQFHLPRDLIREEIRQIREGRYGVFREQKQTIPRLRLGKDLDVYTENVKVEPDSPLRGRTLQETALRRRSGALVLAIVREGEAVSNPEASEIIRSGDTLILAGLKHQLKSATSFILTGE